MASHKTMPGHDLMFLQERMNRVFEDSLRDAVATRNPGQFVPHVDIFEDDTSLTLKAELPGVRKEDIVLDITGGVITISGRKSFNHEEASENFHVIERQYGFFKRSFNLPEALDLDRIDANHHAGVLEVVFHKLKVSPARRIPISREGG